MFMESVQVVAFCRPRNLALTYIPRPRRGISAVTRAAGHVFDLFASGCQADICLNPYAGEKPTPKGECRTLSCGFWADGSITQWLQWGGKPSVFSGPFSHLQNGAKCVFGNLFCRVAARLRGAGACERAVGLLGACSTARPCWYRSPWRSPSFTSSALSEDPFTVPPRPFTQRT